MASQSSFSHRVLPWLGVSIIVILVDQLTKALVRRTMDVGERINLFASFDLTLVYNHGAAFSFLAQESGWQRWLFIGIGVAAAILIVYFIGRHSHQKMFSLAMALILGGALGNVVDRVALGYVVDFLLFYWRGHYFPAFNAADSAITIGAALLIMDELRRVRRER